MKKLLKLIILTILTTSIFQTQAGSFDELFKSWEPTVHIDCNKQDCNLETWIKEVKDNANWIVTDRKFSEYIQDVVRYLLTFVSLVWVIYIIYAWFRILTSAWDEETLKKQKNTVIYVIIWIILMWIAYPIVKFIIDALYNHT